MDFKTLIAIRSRTAYRLLVGLLPISRVSSKPESELTFLTMCGEQYLELLQQCLFSLYSSWSSLPKLRIVSDGTITISKLKRALNWWPGQKSFSSWEESIVYHQQRGREFLVQFALSNIMGKKLAVILESGEIRPTLWCDSDILWFKELLSLPTFSQNNASPILKIAEDYQPSYERRLLDYGLTHLNKQPYMNAGLMYISGNLIESCNLQPLLKLAAEKPSNNSEQTIFAAAAYQLGSHLWYREEIGCSEEDRLSLIPNYAGRQWVARHYVGPVRHLFWRDALALRLGLKNKLFQ